MIVQMEYSGRSAILNGLHDARVQFATNTRRDPTFFRGELAQPVLFREALAALYHVVVSDYKYRPRDRLEFKAWLEEQDKIFLANLGMKSAKAKTRLAELQTQLDLLNQAKRERLRPFHDARQDYFQFVYENEYEEEYLFDPVITVHPDEVSFEAFSRDESTYGRLAAKYELFRKVDEFQCGTTNIDFSAKLHGELERIRSYRQTRFDIAPAGFTVVSDGGSHREKKIDLPDSWIMGFLQVHSTMSMGLTRFHMAPVDLYNICRYLRRRKTRKSPRALRYEFTPGQPVRAVLEPWNHVIELTAASPVLGGAPLALADTAGAVYQGPKPVTIRTWGRDRLLTIARLLPACRRVDVYLAGQGLPSIYVLDLGPVTFTLALSGWTDNDWTGGAKFDLLARRLLVSATELSQTYDAPAQGALRHRRGAGQRDRPRRGEVPQCAVVPVPGGPGDVRPGRQRLPAPRFVPGAVHGQGRGRRRQGPRGADQPAGKSGPGDLRERRRAAHIAAAGRNRLQVDRQRQGRRPGARAAAAARRSRGQGH